MQMLCTEVQSELYVAGRGIHFHSEFQDVYELAGVRAPPFAIHHYLKDTKRV